MKRKIEDDKSSFTTVIDSITEMMKESNMFDEEDEYRMLLDAYHCEWEDTDCIQILKKAIGRYNRYISNINFGEYDDIETRITTFLQKYSRSSIEWSEQGLQEMRDIDGDILQIIEVEELTMGMKSFAIQPHNKKIKKDSM
jgi:hypothetical protein